MAFVSRLDILPSLRHVQPRTYYAHACRGLVVAVALTAGATTTAPADPASDLGDSFRALDNGDFRRAIALARSLRGKPLHNGDYRLYVAAQAQFMAGDYKAAQRDFTALANYAGSRFQTVARWRLADCLWALKQPAAARAAYDTLVTSEHRRAQPRTDLGLARFRMARAHELEGDKQKSARALTRFRRLHPSHPLDRAAAQHLRRLVGAKRSLLTPRDRLARAQKLTRAKHWHQAIAELRQIRNTTSAKIRRERDYWTATTLFKMRRDYERAGRILLRIYNKLGDRAAEALFRGARALSRADHDDEAVSYYLKLVEQYPSSRWAAEAQFLAGWLEYNSGKYRKALPLLKAAKTKHAGSRWGREATWFLAFSHYLLGHLDVALELFTRLGKAQGRLSGGKGHYWRARTLEKKQDPRAIAEYRKLVSRFPVSWYALLARARLESAGHKIGLFGSAAANPAKAPALPTTVDKTLAQAPLIKRADELIAAGLGDEAGAELRRKERTFIRTNARTKALGVLLDRYRRAGNFHRPWMLAVVYGGKRALDAPATGKARKWWQHAYPQAYNDHVKRWQHLGNTPDFYLQSIMRKESGFDPHTHSYADAMGLLQMIPPTTKRVVHALGLTYTEDLLFDPELNIRTGSWYIGKLLNKFRGQIPLGAGAFNSGPRPVMRWLTKNVDRPMDEWVELVSYRQTREYMKKVTETYARYLYLYTGTEYRQPLTVDRNFVVDDITY